MSAVPKRPAIMDRPAPQADPDPADYPASSETFASVTYLIEELDFDDVPPDPDGHPEEDPWVDEEPARFTAVRMSDIPNLATEWIIPGLLPASDVVVLVGEEGIGKGLWWIEQVRVITAAGMPVVLIVAEDDPNRALRPRMDAAGVNLALVHLIVQDTETLTGHPYLPTHTGEVEKILADTGARVLILDPWISTVPGHLSIKDTQQARQALDPLTALARRSGACILAVAHTNRSSGSTRDRVGLTAALRQACRIMVLALEDPEDQTSLLVGVDKANGAARGPAVRWQKAGDDGAAWRVQLADADTGWTIQQWDVQVRAITDGRTSDAWAEVAAVARANGGMVTRSQIADVYGPDRLDAVDKAIGRWIKAGRLTRADKGVFEVPDPQ